VIWACFVLEVILYDRGGIDMDRVSDNLTVYFDDPFWIGVFERFSDGKLSVCKVTFGAEPKDYEVFEFVLKHYYKLKFSPAVEAVIKEFKKQAAVRSGETKAL
jgi:hypothetical protein